jgi:hypothetical protein
VLANWGMGAEEILMTEKYNLLYTHVPRSILSKGFRMFTLRATKKLLFSVVFDGDAFPSKTTLILQHLRLLLCDPTQGPHALSQSNSQWKRTGPYETQMSCAAAAADADWCS